ncbi:hypothetical protein ES705_25370 [subsurface metagenome]
MYAELKEWNEQYMTEIKEADNPGPFKLTLHNADRLRRKGLALPCRAQ